MGYGKCCGHPHLSFLDVFGSPNPAAVPRPLRPDYKGAGGLLGRGQVEWVVFLKVLRIAEAANWHGLNALLRRNGTLAAVWLADVKRKWEMAARWAKRECAAVPPQAEQHAFARRGVPAVRRCSGGVRRGMAFAANKERPSYNPGRAFEEWTQRAVQLDMEGAMFPNLISLLVSRGILQYVLARDAKITETRFSRCMRGRLQFTQQERERIARKLDVDAAWLFQEVEPPAARPAARPDALAVHAGPAVQARG